MGYVGITKACRDLRSLIARVERGEQITITRQGKAVAQLTPPRKARKVLPPLGEFRRELGKAGTPAAELLRTERSVERSFVKAHTLTRSCHI